MSPFERPANLILGTGRVLAKTVNPSAAATNVARCYCAQCTVVTLQASPCWLSDSRDFVDGKCFVTRRAAGYEAAATSRFASQCRLAAAWLSLHSCVAKRNDAYPQGIRECNREVRASPATMRGPDRPHCEGCYRYPHQLVSEFQTRQGRVVSRPNEK